MLTKKFTWGYLLVKDLPKFRFFGTLETTFVSFEIRYKISKNLPITIKLMVLKSQDFSVFKTRRFFKNLGKSFTGKWPQGAGIFFSQPPLGHFKEKDFSSRLK